MAGEMEEIKMVEMGERRDGRGLSKSTKNDQEKLGLNWGCKYQ